MNSDDCSPSEGVDRENPSPQDEAMPNELLIAETERLIAEAVRKIRGVTVGIVDESLSLARAARNARPSSLHTMKAVRPGEPLPEGDLTGRFAALAAK